MRKTKREIMAGVDCEKSRLIDNNTVEYYRADGSKVIRLHLTDIITFNPDGSCTLDSGGWQTVTTKDRMNKYGPLGLHVLQEKSVWYVYDTIANSKYSTTYAKDARENWIPYADGITIHPDGSVKGQGEDPRELIKLQKDINRYVKGFMSALDKRKIEQPGPGDCWGCYFKDKKTGREVMGSDHILDHFKKKYYVPSLLFNAIKEIPVSQVAMHYIGYSTKMHDEPLTWAVDLAKDQVSKSLKRYLKRRLGMAA